MVSCVVVSQQSDMLLVRGGIKGGVERPEYFRGEMEKDSSKENSVEVEEHEDLQPEPTPRKKSFTVSSLLEDSPDRPGLGVTNQLNSPARTFLASSSTTAPSSANMQPSDDFLHRQLPFLQSVFRSNAMFVPGPNPYPMTANNVWQFYPQNPWMMYGAQMPLPYENFPSPPVGHSSAFKAVFPTRNGLVDQQRPTDIQHGVEPIEKSEPCISPTVATANNNNNLCKPNRPFEPSSSDGTDDSRSTSQPTTSPASSCNSPNGQPSLENTGAVCVVCEDKASGYHYGIISCEGCKGFFRRTVQRGLEYVCHKVQACEVTRLTRNRCQFCRFMKCLECGMSRDSVRQDRCRKRKNRDNNAEAQVQASTQLQQAMKSISIAYDSLFRSSLNEISNANILYFANSIQGFSSLTEDDQLILVDAALPEIKMLIKAHNMSINKHESSTVTADDNHVDNKESSFERTRKFMNQLDLTHDEIALLCSICLLSPNRPGLQSTVKVEKLQELCVEALGILVQMRRPDQPNSYAKLLMMLTNVRIGHG